MSQANIDLVRALQPPPDMDLHDTFATRDEEGAAAIVEAARPLFTDDFVCVFHNLSEERRPGLEGLRGAWLDWLEPWEAYRAEIQEVRAVGERVLVLSRDFGKRRGADGEVEMQGGSVWTVRDGRVAEIEFFPLRNEALEALGLDVND